MIKGLNRNLPEQGKIKIGGKGEEKTSRAGNKYRAPQKWDYIQVTTLERDENGDFIVDQELTKALGNGDDKPKIIGPCMFIFNEPELNFYTTYAYYVSSKCICKGNGETAHRLQDNDEIKEIECDPKKCEFARGKKCKPNGILSVLFPWSGTIGGVYKFRTTSWNSIISLKSQLEMFYTLTGGRLSGPKFNLKINKKEAMPGGKKQTIYFLTMEFAGDIQMLLDAVPAGPAARIDTSEEKRLMLEAAGQIDDDPDEFYPEHSIDDSGMVTDANTGEVVDKVDDEPEVAPESPFAKKEDVDMNGFEVHGVPKIELDGKTAEKEPSRADNADKVHLIETAYIPASNAHKKTMEEYDKMFSHLEDHKYFPTTKEIVLKYNPDAKSPEDLTESQVRDATNDIILDESRMRRKMKHAEEPVEEVEATPTGKEGDDAPIF
jgi:hypothetical protein